MIELKKVKNSSFKILIIFLLFPFNSFSNYVLLNSNFFSDMLLELVESKYEKQKGLMNLDKLIDSNGMLFLYKQPKVIKMWMHNTKIPLDIIFIDKFNRVISINYGKPLSKKIISSEEKAIAVIEIPYKCAKKLKINKGDRISWVRIDKNKKKIIRYYHCLAK